MWKGAQPLIWAVLIPLLGGAISGFATRSSTRGPWFRTLRKPPWNPPSAVFPVVWSVLYIMMGIASWIVWTSNPNAEITQCSRRHALTLYAIQLGINLAWSFVFFVGHHIRGALGVIVGLFVALAATIACFWNISHTAALLLLPYAAWVAFALALNWSIASLNPGR